jgi:hypothetical protein
MKKIILLTGIAFLTLSVSAQKLKNSEVPATIKTSFEKLYPSTKVENWEKEGNNYEAEFTKESTEMSVLLGPNGQLIETETEIKPADLPPSVSAAIKKNFAGKTVKEASKIVDTKGGVTYEAEINGKDYLFDINGNMITKTGEPKN